MPQPPTPPTLPPKLRSAEVPARPRLGRWAAPLRTALCRAACSGALLLGLLTALAALTALSLGPARAAEGRSRLQAHRPGEEITVAGCLRLSVLGFSDRSGGLDPVDWVTLKVSNQCDEPARHMLVDLLLLDVTGRVYGARLWVLEDGEVLMPGRSKTDRFAVPDRANYVPQQWAVRLRTVQRPSDRRRRSATTAERPSVTRQAALAAVAAAAVAATARPAPAPHRARRPAVQVPRPPAASTQPQGTRR